MCQGFKEREGGKREREEGGRGGRIERGWGWGWGWETMNVLYSTDLADVACYSLRCTEDARAFWRTATTNHFSSATPGGIDNAGDAFK